MPANLSIPEALGTSLLGFSVVFFGLVAIIGIIKLMTAIITRSRGASAEPAAAAPAPESAPVQAVSSEPAPGTLGTVDLFTVPDKTAAMLMAIVADSADIPLSELKFLSIREVEKDS